MYEPIIIHDIANSLCVWKSKQYRNKRVIVLYRLYILHYTGFKTMTAKMHS